ncbi:MAG: phytoene synthase, partial [Candidatus Azotimanducaceae bacterium]
AMKLGSAFQKVNFLRDLKDDYEELNRSYFPNIDVKNLNNESKKMIIQEIEEDFKNALIGIKKLPKDAKFGVYTAYIYYLSLLKKLKRTPAEEIIKTRIRISNTFKMLLLIKSFITYKAKLI